MAGGRRGVLGVGLVATVLLSACTAEPGSTDPPPAPSVAAPVGLSATVVQYRRDAPRGVLQVKVTNDGPEPVHVTHVRLDTWTFAAAAEADKDSTIAPGLSADLTLPLGQATCDGPDGPQPPPTVRLQVDGTELDLEVDDDVLLAVLQERCRVQSVTEQVTLAVGPGWTDAGEVRGEPALRGTVTATPQPGAPALALAVEGATTLFTVAEPSRVELPAGADPVALDVVLTVTRCDAHAVAEDKKGYLLPVRVAVDGAEPVLVEVAVPVPERTPLQGLIDRTCGS